MLKTADCNSRMEKRGRKVGRQDIWTAQQDLETKGCYCSCALGGTHALSLRASSPAAEIFL